MEGCLYRKCDNRYYLINTIATYNYIAIEFDTFISCFIQNENFNVKYELIAFNSNNVKMLLNTYDEFKGYIDYENLDEFNRITYNKKIYIIKNWRDVFNFVAGRI